MNKLFNLMGRKRNDDTLDDSYSKWLQEEIFRLGEHNKCNLTIEERLTRLEEAVFGDMDDGR